MVVVEEIDQEEEEAAVAADAAAGADDACSGDGDDTDSAAAGAPGAAAPERTPLEERLKSAADDKEKGMRAFEQGDWEGAIDRWAHSRGSLKYVIDQEYLKDDPEALAKVVADQHKMHLNLAQAFINKGEFRQALEYAGRALKNDPDDVKALWRTAVAYKGISLYDAATDHIVRLQKVQPGHVAAKKFLHEMAREEAAAKKTAKKSASRIFEGMQAVHDYRLAPPPEENSKVAWLRALLTCSSCRRRKHD